MKLHINFKSGMPVYLQIVDQIKSMAESGAMRSGEAPLKYQETAKTPETV
jgi:DNA-binding transcriptional regulator YhcF (GntR family)